jgi:hypothetical protein
MSGPAKAKSSTKRQDGLFRSVRHPDPRRLQVAVDGGDRGALCIRSRHSPMRWAIYTVKALNIAAIEGRKLKPEALSSSMDWRAFAISPSGIRGRRNGAPPRCRRSGGSGRSSCSSRQRTHQDVLPVPFFDGSASA